MAVKKKIVKKVVKKAPKKVTKVARKVSKLQEQSFMVVREKAPFLTFKITTQTIYWIIVLVYVLLLSLWILKIQLDTLTIIEKINAL